ncbi:hypothetical protein I302_103488 [Kwoniella bestiolae CBS 10118]|uniref:Tetrapyrrole biosynthesis uroporphyrinogen III synthase domain-containing protein n=1 Tax=Kwoniella bestiolae CBS 10118 TaxID=1296100 RepID=A0A1B9G8J3_9TREE|nr:hypothetical protein I302_02189 [Kwoniella bestiolae CBS 10118]OCF27348.1 hypothetical protein I302_02189 [Kwoniella bestiolae CBS 10118]
MTSTQNTRTRTPIILFKTPSPSDPYTQTLASTSYDTRFIPVLEETYDTSLLTPILESGSEKWEGVIITSRRGAEGWVRAVRQYTSSKGKEKASGSDEGDWDKIPLFTVGTASSDHLLDSGIAPGYIPRLSQYEGGTPPKSAIHLLPTIIDRPPRSEGTYRPYLFIRGDKSTDLLQDGIRGNGRDIREVEVYKTSPRRDIADNLVEFRRKYECSGGEKGWLCFFSPSGAEVVLPLLAKGNALHNQDGYVDGTRLGLAGLEVFWEGWKIFVIGDTTRKYFEEKGIRVDAVAERPNPEGLLEAIRCHDGIGINGD